jgi:hypothetical protein
MPASRLPRILAAALLAAAPLPALAQQQAAPPASASAPADPFAGLPAPQPEDVASIESTLAALYGTISGGVGQKRDWDRFRSLFYPGARLIPTGTPKGADTARARALTPEDYVRTSGPFLERIGFREIEIARRIDRFGHVAHVFSTYDGKPSTSEMAPIRGINSIQLFHDGKRWWVMNIFWMQESAQHPIPKDYLPAAR